MESLHALFCTSLDDEAKDELHNYLQLRRATLVADFLTSLETPSGREKLGTHFPAVENFFARLPALCTGRPEGLPSLINHWALSFLISRLMESEADGTAGERLLSSLNSLLLCTHLLEALPVPATCTYTTMTDARGQLGGLLQNARMHIRANGGGSGVFAWQVSGEKVVLSDTSSHARWDFSLPLSTDAPIEVEAFPVARPWDLPVIENPALLGMEEFEPPEGDPRYVEEPDWQPLSLPQSLEGAHAILRDLWPEVLEWTAVLVPAFVDMGGPPSKSVHRSASHGCGTPIFLTKVGDPFQHAEDVVHELQHHRLNMLPPGTFGCWDDVETLFISPYRKDPRPLRGLHLGLHAFLAVNELRLRSMCRTGPSEKLVYQMLKTHRMNLFAFRTLLEHEEVRSGGRKLFAQMARTLSAQHESVEKVALPAMERSFTELFAQHMADVGKKCAAVENGSPLYCDWRETAIRAADFV